MSTVTGTGAIALLLLIGLAVGQRGSMRTDTEIASINAPDPAELAPAGLDRRFSGNWCNGCAGLLSALIHSGQWVTRQYRTHRNNDRGGAAAARRSQRRLLEAGFLVQI